MNSLLTVNVRYFAAVREALGIAQEKLSTNAQTLEDLRAELMQRDPLWANTLGRADLRAALNQHLVGFDTVLNAGDEVAFFPPVTGG